MAKEKNSYGKRGLFALVQVRQKRPIYIYIWQKRPICIWQKRPICISTSISPTRVTSGEKGPAGQNLFAINRPYTARFQVCVSFKRDLFMRRKRPICMAKETYLHGKRGLFTWQKRPIYMSKETYLCGERGLFTFAFLRHVPKTIMCHVNRSLLPCE